MQQVFTEESLTRADRASRLISGRDVLFGAAQTTRQYHADGYVNVLNQYGTQNDTTEQYEYSPEGSVMDIKLNQLYEGDGLFAKIIDTPADECVKQGFSSDSPLMTSTGKTFFQPPSNGRACSAVPSASCSLTMVENLMNL